MSRLDGQWPVGTEQAQDLVRRIADEEIDVPAGARARVRARIEARRRRRTPLALALLGALSAALVVGLLHRKNAAVTSPATAPVVAVAPAPAPAPAVAAAHLVEHPGQARVVVGAATDARATAGDTLVYDLRAGSLLASVKHRDGARWDRPAMIVRTPHAEVHVIGTVLWVAVAPDGAATVEVAEGVVEVAPASGERVRVRAGERWPASSTARPAASDVRLLGEPAATALLATQETRSAPSVLVHPRPVPATPPPVHGPAPQTVDCAKLEGRSAIACLLPLAGSSDALTAETARYEIGWRWLRDLHDAHRALASFEEVRARFPHGALREEVDTSIIEALVRLGETVRARDEADAWLRRNGRSLAAPEVHYLRGRIAHDEGDCPTALEHLGIALRAPADAWAADARAAVDDCRRVEQPR